MDSPTTDAAGGSGLGGDWRKHITGGPKNTWEGFSVHPPTTAPICLAVLYPGWIIGAMAQCGFCGRPFKSTQAVRGHLRTCEAYQEALEARNAELDPEPRAAEPRAAEPKAERQARARGFDQVAHVRAEADAGEEHLRLRQVQAAHRELDEREAERKRREKERREREEQERAARVRQEAEAKARAQQEREARERREREERESKALRRQKIQRAKTEALGWRAFKYTGVVTSELEAQAREAIEKKLAVLAVEDLDDAELIKTAEAERDRVYHPALEAQRREQEARRREEERSQAEERRRQEATRTRVERGKAYAERELQRASVGAYDQWTLMRQVESALERSIAGDEKREDIEAVVDDVIEPKLEELEKKARAKRKRELVDHGERHARDELRGVEGLDALERTTLPSKIRRELEAELEGDEDQAEVEDLVEDILERELGSEASE